MRARFLYESYGAFLLETVIWSGGLEMVISATMYLSLLWRRAWDHESRILEASSQFGIGSIGVSRQTASAQVLLVRT